MNSQNEILNWVQTLPDWQCEITHRILERDQLNEKDEDDAIRHLKYSKKIVEEAFALKHRTPPIPSPDLPKKSSDNVVLLSLSELSNVNAIADDQILSFGPNGLTVIYGDNAAGKSGYSRVLKRTCWAREDKSPILGNVFLDSAKHNASARIEFQVNGKPQTFSWVDGNTSADILQNIAVFDTECARWYTNAKGETRYLPYGMDVFGKLAAFCDKIRAKLKAEAPQPMQLPSSIQLLSTDKTLGRIVNRIIKGDERVLSEPLLSLNPEQTQRLQTLEFQMSTKSADVITKEIKTLQEKIRRIRVINVFVEQAEMSLSSDSISSTNTNILNHQDAVKALKLSREQVFDSEYLPGTGSEPWKIMYEAAREFSVVAYPDNEFPFIDEESQCPLCQQPLDSKAKERFKSFQSYVEDFAAKKERVAKDALNVSKQKFIKIRDDLNNCDFFPIEETIKDESLLKEIKDKHSTLRSLVDAVVISIEQRTSITVTAPDLKIEQELEKTIADIEKDISHKRKFLESETLKQLENELQSLQNRKILNDNVELIKTYIGNVNLIEKFKQCQKECNTSGITRASSDIISKIVTEPLRTALNEELRNLNVIMPLTFSRSGVKGKAEYGIEFKKPTEKVSSVLSEGESRAVSIAAFLAELNLSENKNPIVFDDPVSSLDHKHRDLLSKRLVSEAKCRQIIIFTHDIYFFQLLADDAKYEGVTIKQNAILRYGNDRTGVCESEPPFIVRDVNPRLNYLETLYGQLSYQYDKEGITSDYTSKVEKFYGDLRSTWEKAVESKLFNKTVVRYRPSIMTRKLEKVKVDYDLYLMVEQGMTSCSKYIDGHDTASAIGAQPPTPDQLRWDLDLFNKFLETIKNKQKKK